MEFRKYLSELVTRRTNSNPKETLEDEVLEMIDIERGADLDERSEVTIPTEVTDVDELATESSSLEGIKKPATDPAIPTTLPEDPKGSIEKENADFPPLYTHGDTPGEFEGSRQEVTYQEDAELNEAAELEPPDGNTPTFGEREVEPEPEYDTTPTPVKSERPVEPNITETYESVDTSEAEPSTQKVSSESQAEIRIPQPDEEIEQAEFSTIEVPDELDLTFNEMIKYAEQQLRDEKKDRVVLHEQRYDHFKLPPVPEHLYSTYDNIYRISQRMMEYERL